MKTTTRKPWNVKIGDVIGCYYDCPGYLRSELITGRVTKVTKYPARFHRGNRWMIETDSESYGRGSFDARDTVLVVTAMS